MTTQSATDLLVTIAEPTRLRIINCLAAAPLFVSDLQAILDLPQPTVSRHLTVLRNHGVVQDTPVGQFVLYRLRRRGTRGGLIGAILEGLAVDEPMRQERHLALGRSRGRTREVLGRVPA
jgi:DNA-binding transcriptional ArsR family regulator